MLFQHYFPKLLQAEKELCDQNITIQEVVKSLKQLPNNKTPCTDGVTSDFYHFFWLDIKEFVF